MSHFSCISFLGSPVNINGGYRDPNKGFLVEINIDGVSQSVLFSELTFPDLDEAEIVFIQTFGMSFEEARKKCKIDFTPRSFNQDDDKAIISLEELPEKVLYEALCTECNPDEIIDNLEEEDEDGEPVI